MSQVEAEKTEEEVTAEKAGGLTPFRAHSGLQEIPIATQKDSGVLCFPSRRGLIPRVSMVCNPKIPVAPRDEHDVLDTSLDEVYFAPTPGVHSNSCASSR